jgi:hypothetical protein
MSACGRSQLRRVVQFNLYGPFMQVKTLRLAESLHKTQRFQFPFVSESGPQKAEKMIELTLGFRQEEYNLGNCGVFLYWHGRLIEVLVSLLLGTRGWFHLSYAMCGTIQQNEAFLGAL